MAIAMQYGNGRNGLLNVGMSMTLLWTNVDDESAFAAQTLSLSLGGYDAVLIKFKLTASGSIYANTIGFVGEQTTLYSSNASTTSYTYKRYATITTSDITFSTGYRGATAGTSYAIPCEVYGIKRGGSSGGSSSSGSGGGGSGTLTQITFNNAVYPDDGTGNVTLNEADPVFTASVANTITSTDITNWNTKAPAIQNTASGSVVNFPDGSGYAFDSIVANIAPVQDTSGGDPSPTNICPITGWTGVNVYRESAYDAAATASLTLSWQTEAGTVYGGTIDVTTGLLTVDAMLEVFDEITGDGGIQSQINYFRPSTAVSTVGDYTRISFGIRGDIQQSDYNLISSSYSFKMCNMLKHYFAYNDESSHWYRNTSLYAFFPSSLVGTTATSVINYLKSIKDTNPLSFWVPLTNPQTYQLTAQQLNTLYGDNSVWTDIGDIAVTYIADTKKYVDGWREIATITLDEAVTSYRIPIPATATEIEASYKIYRSDTTSTYLWIAPTTSGWSNHNIFNRYGPNTNTYWWGTCHVWLNNGYSSSILQNGGGGSLSNFFGVGNQGWMNGQAYIDFQSNPGICFNLSSGLGVGSTFTVRYR